VSGLLLDVQRSLSDKNVGVKNVVLSDSSSVLVT